MCRTGKEKEGLCDRNRGHGRTHIPHSQAGASPDLLSRWRWFERQAATYTGAGSGDGPARAGAHLRAVCGPVHSLRLRLLQHHQGRRAENGLQTVLLINTLLPPLSSI